jgi:hypothetical protein
MTGSCRDVEALLSPYLDGELEPEDARRVQEHVGSCAACRSRLESARAAERALARTAPVRSDLEWERLARRVEAAIDAEERGGRVAAAPAPGARGRRWWLWSGSGALVAAALVLLFWPWVVPETGTPPSIPASRTAAPPTPAPRTEAETETRSAPDAAAPKEVFRPEAVPVPPAAPPAPPPTEDAAGPAPAVPEPAGAGTYAAKPPRTKGIADAPPPLDVRRVAIAQEQELRQRAALAPSARGVGSLEELASRFEALRGAKGSPGRLLAREERAAPEPGSAKSLEADRGLTASARDEAAPLPAPSLPARVLGWANERRAAGDLAAAREAYSMLAGEFPANVAREEASFALVEMDARAALASRAEMPLRDAATQAEAFLRDFPASARRAGTLALRVRVLATLAAADPDRWCDAARAAREEWRREAPADAAEPSPPDLDATCAE